MILQKNKNKLTNSSLVDCCCNPNTNNQPIPIHPSCCSVVVNTIGTYVLVYGFKPTSYRHYLTQINIFLTKHEN